MAWIVIRAVDNHRVATASPEERRGLWQRGDVVDVLDIHPGRKVISSANLLAYEIEGVTAAELAHLKESGVEGARRAVKLRLDESLARLPANARSGAGDRLTRAMARAFEDAAEARV